MNVEDLGLLPCPFCGAGETKMELSTHWTGLRSQVISATVMHWCWRDGGQPQSLLKISGRTEAKAIENWNARPL